MASRTTNAFINMQQVTKRYAGVVALDDVNFTVMPGEIVCLAGENGSGKSTLIKILAGIEHASAGEIFINGKNHKKLNPRVSSAAGVMVIFQDFSLFPNLTVAENISFSTQLREHKRYFNSTHAKRIARKALERIDVDIPLDALVESLPVAHKQLIGICRALACDARLIIMDEPTTALTEREVRSLLDIIRRLKSDGVAVVFVSHKLAEVMEVSDKVVVLRNGKKVADGPASDFDAASLTRHMTGHDVLEAQPSPLNVSAKEFMVVKNLNKAGVLTNINFNLKAGEVLGLTGLLGSGRTSLAKALFGLTKADSGTLTLDSKKIALGDPVATALAGIGYVPEDRLTEGLFLTQSIVRNVAIGRLDEHQKNGFLNINNLIFEATDWLKRLKVKTPNIKAPVKSLSGGNQQRVSLARWLARSPKVLILNGPSVGVDVGSKAEIHDIIRDLAQSGIGIIMISDDLPELLATCQRILIMKSGEIVQEIDSKSINEEELSQRLAS